MSNNSSSNDTINYHVCRICGDRAIGYNFSVLTCEPCKAFFRRTADKLEELQCPFNNDCDIDRVTRKICRRCRLVKCLKVGMRKDWAQGDDDKKSRYSNCSNLPSRSGKSPNSLEYSSMSSIDNFKGRSSSIGDDRTTRDRLTSRLHHHNVEQVSSTSNRLTGNWSTCSAPSSSSNLLNKIRCNQSFPPSTSLSSSFSSSSTSSLSSSSSSFLSPSKYQRSGCKLSSLSPTSSSYHNHFEHNKHPSSLMSIPCSSSSSSSIMSTFDVINSLQQNCCPQSNYKRQSRDDIQSILRSTSNSDWLIRFLVESHALNLPTSKPMMTSSIPEFNVRSNQQQAQQSFNRLTESDNCLQSLQLTSKLDSNPCTRVGVIVDGRKFASSNSPSPPAQMGVNESDDYLLMTSRHQLPPHPPPLLTQINHQIDQNLKARVIRKILDANFAPSHLKQGSRKGVALDDLESGTIDTLVNAFDFFNQPLTVNNCELSSIEGITQFTDLYLEKLISGCRFLPSYAKLCLEDQITLVKGGFPDILAVKSHLCASLSTTNPPPPPSRSTTTSSSSTIKPKMPSSTSTPSSSPRGDDNCWQPPPTNHNIEQSVRRIHDSFRNSSNHGNAINNWISEPKVICILIAIVLFNPELPNLQAIDSIKLEQYTYIYLLKRYLESQCGSSCRARTEHFNLIYSIERIMASRLERNSFPNRMPIDATSSPMS